MKVHVFYTDPMNGWAAATLDQDDHQIGEAKYHYRKTDAIAAAKEQKLPVHVFGRNGLFQRKLEK